MMSITIPSQRFIAYPALPQVFSCALVIGLLAGPAPAFALTGSHPGAGRAVAAKTTQQRIAPAYCLVPGTRMVYRLDYANVSTSDFRALLGGQQPANAQPLAAASNLVYALKTAVHGEWEVTLLSRKADSVLVRYRLRTPSVRLNINGQEPAAQVQTLQQDLSRDLYAVLDLRGRVVSVRLDPAMGSLSQSYARTLLSETQCVLPGLSSPGLRAWQTREDDPNGAYIARYRREVGSRKGAGEKAPTALWTLQKSKVRYLPPSDGAGSGENDVPTTIRPQGSLVAQFDGAAGRLRALAGTETQTQSISGKTVAHAQTTLRMNYLRTETLAPVELTALRNAETAREKTAPAVALSVRPSRAESEAIVERTQLGNATLESLLAALGQAEAAKDPKADNTPLYLKFKALVYLHPETSAGLGKILASAAPGSLSMHLLVGALIAAGHPQAQAALVAAIQARPTDLPALVSLVPGLGLVAAPTPEAEATLQALAERSSDPDIAAMSQLCLGAMARRLAQISPQRAGNILTWLVDRLDTAKSVEEQRRRLLALGNAGSTRALPAITHYLSSPSPDLRSAATVALRWMASSRADTLLVSRLRSDPEAAVRTEAAFALGFRAMQPNTYQVQKQALLTDKSAYVRQMVLANLWKVRANHPEIPALVKTVRSRDAAKQVREMAAGMLAQNLPTRSHSALLRASR